ncbi:hypothetical protein P4S72_16495 [Vibrio sp. PP-XX7]
MLFEEHERGPSDDLALQLETISQMPEGEQMVIREVLESLIIKYQPRRGVFQASCHYMLTI